MTDVIMSYFYDVYCQIVPNTQRPILRSILKNYMKHFQTHVSLRELPAAPTSSAPSSSASTSASIPESTPSSTSASIPESTSAQTPASTSSSTPAPTPTSTPIQGVTTQIYLLGDIEGDLPMVIHWFIDHKFISPNLEYIAQPHQYVFQLGDQVDENWSDHNDPSPLRKPVHRRVRHPSQHSAPDWLVVIFFDILNYISKGHICSVLGNHEIINIQGDARYSQSKLLRPTMFENPKSMVFQILNRRQYILTFRNLILSHAGLTQSIIDKWKFITKKPFELKSFVTTMNAVPLMLFYKNMDPHSFIPVQKLVNELVWNRDYNHNQTFQITEPSLSRSILVIGHNNLNAVMFCSNTVCADDFDLDNLQNLRLIKTDSGNISRQCKGQQDSNYVEHFSNELTYEQYQQYMKNQNYQFIEEDETIEDGITNVSSAMLEISPSNQLVSMQTDVYRWNCMYPFTDLTLQVKYSS
jgi:hypothetical protein